jgi:hypothetical protein
LKLGSVRYGDDKIMATDSTRTPELADAPVHQTMIKQSDLPPGESYLIKTPIPVQVVAEDDVDFIATFDEAGISIAGESFDDVLEALVNEVLDLFDYLTEHHAELGAEPQRQFAVLSKYLGKAND